MLVRHSINVFSKIYKRRLLVRVLTHMAIHNQEKPFLCNHCGRTFKQLAQLKNHEVIHKTPEEVKP